MVKEVSFAFRISVIGICLVFGACHLVLIRNDNHLSCELQPNETLPDVAQDLSPHIRLSGRSIRQDSFGGREDRKS
jgi:hypothetical protein